MLLKQLSIRAELCLFSRLSLSRSLIYLLLILFSSTWSSCKKELNQIEDKEKSEYSAKKINFAEFLSSTKNADLGFLKSKLNRGIPGQKLMSIGEVSSISSIDVYTDTITTIKSNKGTSYVFKMPLTSPHSTSFRNLTIEVQGGITTAFIATYFPNQKWINAYKAKKNIPFEGDISFSPISLEALNIQESLAAYKGQPGEKIMSNNKTSNIVLCTDYTVYTLVPYGCSDGNHFPGDMLCLWNWPGESPPAGESRGGYSVSSSSWRECETIITNTGGGGGGGGGTVPGPPGGYDPCQTLPPDISIRFEPGTRLAVVPPPPCDLESPQQLTGPAQFLVTSLNITNTSTQSYLQGNLVAASELVHHLNVYGNSESNKDFVRWAAAYLSTNQNTVSFETFKYQFLSLTAEGSDGVNDYDVNYWNDPNLSIQQQTLPNYTDFYLAYPKNPNGFELEAPGVFNLVGGTPKALRDASLSDSDPNNNNTYNNACALRVSRALNYSGVIIPEVSGTYKGGDGKNYFLSAASLFAWMKKAFPPNPFNSISLNSSNSGPYGAGYANALAGSKGIYIMIPNYPGASYFGASGHAGLHANTPVTHYYFNATGGVSEIILWKLY